MCYDPDISKVVTEHHLKEAERMRKQGQEQKAKRYLQQQGVTKETITFKYSRLKSLLD